MAAKRDTSKDGFRNELETYALTHFKPIWNLIQNNDTLKKIVNKFLVNNAIYKVPTRPYPFSNLSAYTSWDSLTDRTYSGLHLPPRDWQPLTNKNYLKLDLAPTEDFDKKLPNVEELRSWYRQTGETKYSPKSTLIFPYFVQWFTDSFLRTDRHNHRKNTSNHQRKHNILFRFRWQMHKC